MKTAVFFINNPLISSNFVLSIIRNADTFIGVDGGIQHIIDLNLFHKTKFVIGDFDSFKNPEIYFDKNKIITLPEEKDDTDSLAALKNFKNSVNDFENWKCFFLPIYGDCQDHFLSLIYSLYTYSNVELISHNERYIFLESKREHKFKSKNIKFSFFPLMPLQNCRFKGCKYTFPSQNLDISGQGVSNKFTESESLIYFESGYAVMKMYVN